MPSHAEKIISESDRAMEKVRATRREGCCFSQMVVVMEDLSGELSLDNEWKPSPGRAEGKAFSA